MVKLHVFVFQLTYAHRMDAFGVHMPDNTVDLLEVGQREVKPFGNEELPSALAPIVADFLCAHGIVRDTGFPKCLPQPFLYPGQGYLRTVIFLFGFAVEFFGKIFLDFDDVMYLVRYDFHLGSTGHFNVTPFVRGGLRRAPCPSGKEQHE